MTEKERTGNRGETMTNMMRRLAQMLVYISDHRGGFYRREMMKALEMSESSSRRWMSVLEEAGLVWKWRLYGNDPYLWRGTFVYKRLPPSNERARRPLWL
jgi:hypothetical protein